MSKLARFAFLSFMVSVASLLASPSLLANEIEASAKTVAEGPSKELLFAENQESADNVLNNDPAVVQGTFVGEAKSYVIRLRGSAPLELFRK